MKKPGLLPLLFILCSCATQGPLGGGKVDDQAPKLVRSNLDSINFKEKKINLTFNEYVTLNDPDKNILLQPAHSTMKFSVSKKTVTISFDSALRENTTYNLIIDGGIADNNAGVAFNFSRTFSTGPYLDTNNILIRIEERKDMKNLRLALTVNDGSDSFKSFYPEYSYIVSKDFYTFSGLGNQKYIIWLYTDNNSDKKPDLYQAINFIKYPKHDTLYTIKPMYWQAPLKIASISQTDSSIKIKYNHSNKYVQELTALLGKDIIAHAYYFNEDSALFNSHWLNSEQMQRFRGKTDTVKRSKFSPVNEVRQLVKESIHILRTRNHYQVTFLKPQLYLKKDSIRGLTKETVVLNKLDSFLLYRHLDSSAADTIFVKGMPFVDYKTLGYLHLTFRGDKKYYTMRLIKDEKEVLYSENITEYEDYLEPGAYTLQVFEYNPAQLFNPIELIPAPKKLIEKNIILKANWEEVLDVLLD